MNFDLYASISNGGETRRLTSDEHLDFDISVASGGPLIQLTKLTARRTDELQSYYDVHDKGSGLILVDDYDNVISYITEDVLKANRTQI